MRAQLEEQVTTRLEEQEGSRKEGAADGRGQKQAVATGLGEQESTWNRKGEWGRGGRSACPGVTLSLSRSLSVSLSVSLCLSEPGRDGRSACPAPRGTALRTSTRPAACSRTSSCRCWTTAPCARGGSGAGVRLVSTRKVIIINSRQAEAPHRQAGQGRQGMQTACVLGGVSPIV